MRSQPRLQKPRHHLLSYFRKTVLVMMSLTGAEMASACQEKDSDPFGFKKKDAPSVVEDSNCYAGCPEGGSPTDKQIKREVYTYRNDKQAKSSRWVAYCFTKEDIGKRTKGEDRQWTNDVDLEDDETLEIEDYIGSSKDNKKHKPGDPDIDRGHQAPAANFWGTGFAQTTNSNANITPQYADLNKGAWKNEEETERELAQIYEKVCVVTGPLYEKEMPPMSNTKEAHKVPSGYMKAIIVDNIRGQIKAVDTPAQIKAVAFIMDQELDFKADFCGTEVSIDEVEGRAKLDLFPQLPDDIEAILEARGNLKAGGESGELAVDMGCVEGKNTKKKKASKKKYKKGPKKRR